MPGGVLFPTGFFLLGWADPISQMFGLVFVGASFPLNFQAGINQCAEFSSPLFSSLRTNGQFSHADLTDAYTIWSASRGQHVYALHLRQRAPNLGVRVGCSVLGASAAALGSVPFLFYGMFSLAARLAFVEQRRIADERARQCLAPG